MSEQKLFDTKPLDMIFISDHETKDVPFWWQKKGLSETSTGYGSRLRTRTMMKYRNKWRRVYCTCWGNAGSCFIIVDKEKVYVH